MLRSKIHIKRKGAFFSILAVVLFALVGLTIAFNSDIKLFGNLFKAGAYEVEYKEEFTSPTDWTPCTETPKLVNVKNNSPVNVKVRLKYDEFWRNKADTQNLPLIKDGSALAIINFQNEDDWTQHGEWYYYNEDLAPGESTSSLFKSVTLDCNANLAAEKVCYDSPTGTVCEEPDDDDAYDKYHLAVTIQTSDEDFPRTDEHYTVTIDPNGGTYNNSSEVYSASLNYGTVIDLSQAVYVGHDLEYWTLNDTDTYTDSSITVEDNISLKANWISSTWHTVTVDPNGGDFEGHTTSYNTSVREGTNFTLSSTEPTKDNFLFDGWTVNGVALENFTFTVNEDVTILANWSPIIAQNNRTSKFYRSITAAEAEASSGDTISLVADAEEEFTNTKNITLDLNTLKLNGSIINNSTLTLLNGEINNDAGAAVTNNGTLTMGINDHIDDNTANIENTYVRLVGTDTGLKQNGEFNFYDGYIEGDVALVGGYDDSPFYRRAMDDEIVYYFPFVDKSPDDNDKQRVILESSDLAVSKTKVGGDIYYYNLQDNINTSIRTGYKIYIARDFDANYSITSEENTNVTIDLCGFNITINNTITINGTLTIEDSSTTIFTTNADDNTLAMPDVNGNVTTTPHSDNTTTTITYGGKISIPQTMVIYGNLIIRNTLINSTTTNDTMTNHGLLTMRNGAIGATNGYVTRPTTDSAYDLDQNSYLYSTTTPIKNGSSTFEWNTEGIIWGQTNGIESGTVVINNGTIFGKRYGIREAAVTLNNGAIKSGNNNGNYSSGVLRGTFVMNGGSITVSSPSSSAYGLDESEPFTINGGNITVSGKTAYGMTTYVSGGSNPRSINGGNITVASSTGSAIGYKSTWNDKYLVMTGGIIKVTSENGTAYGVNTSAAVTMTGGKIESEDYGIYTDTNKEIKIGNDDGTVSIVSPEIIGGSYALYGKNGNGYAKFYDGVLRGGVKAYEDGIVKEIADNTAVHMETQILDEAEYDTRYLEQARPVAKIGGAQYIRLVDAITAAGPDDTIELLEDNYVFNTITIPETKVFTIQTNGFDIIPSNTITNNGKVTITTRPDASIPTISNYSPNYIIVNSQGADLEINRTNINSAYAINNKGTLTLSNSDIVSSNTSINNTGTINADNISLTANTYPVYNDGGEISATNNSSIQNGTIYNKSGTITMTDSVATNAASTNTSFITNYGALELNGSTASQVITSTGLGYHIWTRTIYNAGSLSANNNSSILQSIDVSTYCYYYLSSIYNDGGNVLVTNSNITTDTATSNYSSIVAGIYNPSGSTVFKTGTINAINRNNVNDSVYGIYNNTGTVTIGVPEPEDSPHYGRDTADVSTSNPDIRAIDLRTRGTINGTGVKNNSGKIYYYDGKIAGTKEALPEKPAGVEYLYEPCTELDTSVTPNLYTAHLFWMRDGQSSCANN